MSSLADAFCFHKCFPAVYNWDVYALLIFLFRCHKNRRWKGYLYCPANCAVMGDKACAKVITFG